MTNFVKKLTFHRSANKLSFWVLSAKKKKGDGNSPSPFPLAHTLPQVLAEKLTVTAMPSIVQRSLLGATPIVAHFASVAGAAKIVVDELKRTTASGLEQ